jgi:vitamin B12 transporter
LKKIGLISILLIAFCSRAQVREQKVKEITIEGIKQEERRLELNKQSIDRNSIQEMQPEDLGVMMQKFPGISLKSYGGLGGLKTFSFRSLGAQHTSTVLDGFLIQNAQSGQLNLGQLQINSIERIEFGFSKTAVLTPVSALFGSNELSLRTFEGSPSFNTTKFRFSTKYGSFGQLDEYLAIHFSKEKIGVTLHGKFRKANGNYPFQLKFSNYSYDGVQENNELQELYSGLSVFFRPNKMKQPIRFIYRNTFIDQGLPGATVLYNNYGKQYLKTEQHTFNLDWTDKIGLSTVRYYGSYQNDNQIYTDSFYLNSANLFRKEYKQDNASAGIRLSKNKFGELINFYGGVETRFSQLTFRDSDLIRNQRWQTFTNVGIKMNEKKFLIDLRAGYQYVYEPVDKSNPKNTRHLPVAALALESKEMGKLNWKIGGLASLSSRMPSFNELYYSQLSKLSLNPEKVKQITISNGISKVINRLVFSTKIHIYYNHITDKIVAIPTKNLFVWSIQNIGEVHASGLDLVQNINIEFNKNWKGNLIFSLYRKNSGFRFSSLFVGERYSLNQNVPANLLEGFYTMDLAAFQSFTINKKNIINLQFQVKNVANLSYVNVRSFAMPGRNYLLSLNYEL